MIQARRLLLDAIHAVAKGEPPRGSADSYYTLQAAEAIIARDVCRCSAFSRSLIETIVSCVRCCSSTSLPAAAGA